MGLYKYLQKAFQKTTPDRLQWQREIEWRKEPATVVVKRPTNLARARALGYRAKEGILIIRIRIPRGGRQRPAIRKGRRPKHFRQRLVLKKSYQVVAEQRVAKKFHNLEVLNSYECGRDGKYLFFEIIAVNPQAPTIKSDPQLQWIGQGANKRRAMRGLTSAARRSRGLLHKGIGAEKLRPSLRAHQRKGK